VKQRQQRESFFLRQRQWGLFPSLNTANDLLQLRKEKKREESLVLKELTCSELYFERLTNSMSNIERLANSGLKLIWRGKEILNLFYPFF